MFIIYVLKSKYLIIGYSILVIGILILISAVIIIPEKKQYFMIIKPIEDDFKRTIEPVTREFYPNAQFLIDNHKNIYENTINYDHIIKLNGYTYQNQPDFDIEKAKWEKISQNNEVINFPEDIEVHYHFSNNEYPFAKISLKDLSLSYDSDGMTKKELALLEPMLREYIKSRHSNFTIESKYSFFIRIYKELSKEEEKAEAEFWKDYVKINNINKNLVQIYVSYEKAKYSMSSRSARYNVTIDHWSYTH